MARRVLVYYISHLGKSSRCDSRDVTSPTRRLLSPCLQTPLEKRACPRQHHVEFVLLHLPPCCLNLFEFLSLSSYYTQPTVNMVNLAQLRTYLLQLKDMKVSEDFRVAHLWFIETQRMCKQLSESDQPATNSETELGLTHCDRTSDSYESPMPSNEVQHTNFRPDLSSATKKALRRPSQLLIRPKKCCLTASEAY